jgi:hypothetical protein
MLGLMTIICNEQVVGRTIFILLTHVRNALVLVMWAYVHVALQMACSRCCIPSHMFDMALCIKSQLVFPGDEFHQQTSFCLQLRGMFALFYVCSVCIWLPQSKGIGLLLRNEQVIYFESFTL